MIKTATIYAYKMRSTKEVIYVGQTIRSSWERFLDRTTPKAYGESELARFIQDYTGIIDIIELKTVEFEGRKPNTINKIESQYIKLFRPRFNKMHNQ